MECVQWLAAYEREPALLDARLAGISGQPLDGELQDCTHFWWGGMCVCVGVGGGRGGVFRVLDPGGHLGRQVFDC